MNVSPKIVFTGCGQIGTLAHLPALSRLQKQNVLRIAAVCDANPARAAAAAAQFGVSAHGSDWRQLAEATGADAVSFCLPPAIAAEAAVEALQRRLHVVCEKPPGRTYDQAARMAAAAGPDQVTMVAFNRRFAPLYRKAAALSARLGPPQAFYGRFTRGSMGKEPSNTLQDWITSDGSHALDLAIATIGFPHRASVARSRSGPGPDNVWTIHLTSAEASAVLLFSFAAGRRLERFEWAGPGYDAVLELPEKGEWRQQGGETELWNAAALTGNEAFETNYGFEDEYRCFAEAIAGTGQRPAADFLYGAAFMRLVELILHSESGDSFPVPPPAAVPVSSPIIVPESAAPVLLSGRPRVSFLQSRESLAAYMDADLMAGLASKADLHFSDGDDLQETDVLVLGWGASPVTEVQLAAAVNLKFVVVLGASIKWALPVEALAARGIPVCNTADAIAQSVAEHCLLLTLAGLRRLSSVDRAMRSGGWPPGGGRNAWLRKMLRRAAQLPLPDVLKQSAKPLVRPLLGGNAKGPGWNDLQGQTVGLIGWGHIARHFVSLLHPFRCRVLVCSEYADGMELEAAGVERTSLGVLLATSAVVSLHKGLTEETRGYLGEREISLLQPQTVLVNTARGGLVDEAALVRRLQKGDLVAALDVFEQEPLPPRHVLRTLDNVILTPHNASSTPQCRSRVGAQAAGQILNRIAGHEVPVLRQERLRAMS